ncbi:MAG: hypothetical protein RLY56_2012 [Pseudomonadota bacterium]
MPRIGSSFSLCSEHRPPPRRERNDLLLVFCNRVYILTLGLTRNWRKTMAKAKKKAKAKAKAKKKVAKKK